MIRFIIAAMLLLAFTISAEARQRHRTYLAHPDCNILWPCEGVAPSPRGERIAKQVGFGIAQKIYTPRTTEQPRKQRVRTARKPHVTQAIKPKPVQFQSVSPRMRPSTELDNVIPVLADKVRDIVLTCGSKIWSTVRHTFIAGTRIMSQHASGTAVDVHGNPSCIYALLKDWPGGYSIDYGRVNHVHISYGGREHGARFVHGGGRHYARHRHRIYASVNRW